MQDAPRPVSLGFETILVATDFSAFAQKALQKTVLLAHRFKSSVVLAHVIDPVVYANAQDGEHLVLSRIAHDAREKLEEAAEIFKRENIPCEIVLEQGAIRDTLCEIVRSRSADLLVISSHGDYRFDRAVCGSIAEKILRVSPCPVMVVGPHFCPPEALAFVPQRLLFPVEFADHSLRLLPFVDALAHHLGAELYLLHVCTPENNQLAANKACLEMLEAEARHHVHMTSNVHCLVQAGTLGAAIAAVASSINAVATVLGVQEEDLMRMPVGGLHQGLVYQIAAQTCCPVITLHSGIDISELRATVSAEMTALREGELSIG